MVMLTPALIAIFFGAFVGSSLSKIGQRISDYMPAAQVKLINILLASIAGAALFALFGAGVEWFYQIANPVKTLYIPAGVGAALGLILAITTTAKSPLPTGLIIYTITRTILNGTRSVEPLVMAIIAVIWVGIGPFAGSLALALHTVAALAKLYSEQVESISAGPIEAVQATGANQLQTIVYAVVPQIIPPYISFTMYRWDINVRMSTIIGFVGGGGIGFLLSQNINLLDYRAASAQMLAIAVVVASMDYISSVIREKFV
ncbi:MAG: ABC transporter permease subunit [Anaerolineae bacterium]|nr:ABC transporter permease subunit [Anaerolineae bacterium]MBT7073359.1 ABC transporter permease subunit [Anaerolineae bacterium]MBT7782442.1 ABC transporter permease subunit [Anaerolineae bacterium]